MGYDYALVHLTYTIPPAILLSIIYAPLCTALDCYKILLLIFIAVTATIPWDSYLIRSHIWSYPPNVVFGPTLYSIPLEEVFFFVIQTFNTSLLYLILSKPVLHPVYLVKEQKGDKWKYGKLAGQLVLAGTIKKAIEFVRAEADRTYLGLILLWATPFLCLLWSLAYQLLVQLPLTSTLLPIVIPTVYLWIVDTLALNRGTWVIEPGTKTGWQLWPGLEAEEAIFFLLTNTLVVCGLVAFDNAIAVLTAFPAHFPHIPRLPSPLLLVRALLLPAAAYDDDRIRGLQQAVRRLRDKSRSFYLASGTFQGRLRIDLILLYSFCRVADDLIDHAKSAEEARAWIAKLSTFLDLSYGGGGGASNGVVKKGAANGHLPEAKAQPKANDPNSGRATLYAVRNFPADAQLTLLLLPTDRLDKGPLYELLQGFEMDLAFANHGSGPIRSEADLDRYGARVAGTVALLCIQLVLFHYPGTSETAAKRVMAAGHDMGIALQYTNIARDLGVDAQIGRCYVPPGWLKKEKLALESFISHLRAGGPASSASSSSHDSVQKKVESVRIRLLDRAFDLYTRSVGAIEELPAPARAPMRVAVESYMQIGRELRSPGYKVQAGRATVPTWKRIRVAWRALIGPKRR